MNITPIPFSASLPRRQQGVTTLAITMLLLVIITVIVLFSTNVAFFEQRTATNQNRSVLADQSAEYALNLTGEWIKANMTSLVATGTGGWLSSGSSRRWKLCSDADAVTAMAANASHPCWAERDATRRGQLYFYNFSNSMALPYSSIGGAMTGIGGASGTEFPVTTTVNALLCRLDTTLSDPDCRAIPEATSANRVAITVIAATSLDTSAASVVKETWASYSSATGTSAVPLLASGTVKGLGNATIVTAPNGAGYGLPVSIWTACPVDIQDEATVTTPAGCSAPGAGASVASVSTCHRADFLDGTPEAELKTTCVTSNNACRCDDGGEFLSGHVGSERKEGIDILDRDGNLGENAQGQAIPDITFFPGAGLDDATDPLDDSLFEWIFAQDVVSEGGTAVNTNCGPSGNENCIKVAMRDTFGATMATDCSGLSSASSGIFYIEGDCDLPSQVGSSTNSVIVVVKDPELRVSGQMDFYGMLFITSDVTGPASTVEVTGNGNPVIVGSLVVEGEVRITGGLTVIYDNANTDTPGNPLPPNTRFAKVAGSWLDNRTGF